MSSLAESLVTDTTNPNSLSELENMRSALYQMAYGFMIGRHTGWAIDEQHGIIEPELHDVTTVDDDGNKVGVYGPKAFLKVRLYYTGNPYASMVVDWKQSKFYGPDASQDKTTVLVVNMTNRGLIDTVSLYSEHSRTQLLADGSLSSADHRFYTGGTM